MCFKYGTFFHFLYKRITMMIAMVFIKMITTMGTIMHSRHISLSSPDIMAERKKGGEREGGRERGRGERGRKGERK